MEKFIKKYSRQREAILSILKSVTNHPCAEWVYNELKNDYPNLSLGTVYRNLSQFSEEGVIEKMELRGGKIHFDGNTEPHNHFICEECREISDIFEEFSCEMQGYIAKLRDVKVNSVTLNFYGLCHKCINTNLKGS